MVKSFGKFQTPKSFGISGFQNKSSTSENSGFQCEKVSLVLSEKDEFGSS